MAVASALVMAAAGLLGAGLGGLTWTAGTDLTSGPAATMRLTTTATPRQYELATAKKGVQFKMLRLSGEREVPLSLRTFGEGLHDFTGDGYELTIRAAKDDLVVAEYRTAEDRRGLAFVEVSAPDGATTATLGLDSGSLYIVGTSETLFLRAVGAQAFRDQGRTGYRLVVPMEEKTTVLVGVSTAEKTDEDIKAAAEKK